MLKVRNWEKFQHYKDRDPPWIKLHFALLSSEDWVCLGDADRVLAIACMLVASRNKGFVPNNPAYMKRVAYLNALPDFRPLISCGFFEKPLANASATQADASPEERQSREESLSETSSDAKPKKSAAKKREYPPDFEALWREYPTDPNMSKSKAFDAYAKLDAADKAALAASIRLFREYCRVRPDYRPKHMVGFITERRFDGFAPKQTSPTDAVDRWQKRLRFARERHVWSSAQWGPRPGKSGCEVPATLLQPGDGDEWTELEREAA